MGAWVLMLPLATLWQIARRDLATRIRGLRLLAVCLFLGVATLAAIGSLTSGITSELEARGQTILGGDIEFSLPQREATRKEMAGFHSIGTPSSTVRLRAMANAPGGDALLSELKAVDGAYPLYGTMRLESGARRGPPPPGAIWIGKDLASRLGLKVGGPVTFGEKTFRIDGIIAEEPDRLGEGFALGPIAIIGLADLPATQLIQPGSLYESKYRVRLPAGADPAAAGKRLTAEFPEAGWKVTDRSNGAPGTRRFIERMGQFLALVGLACVFVTPLVLFYFIASVSWRSQELSMIAQSMAQMAVRFSEPEHVASDAMVTVGQAIRREVAAMGDGVERAIARAGELEALVTNEVSALERAYSDNEVRIRALLQDISTQRDNLVGQAEQVRNAISGVQIDLRQDIAIISDAIAARVDEVTNNITHMLEERSDHITGAFAAAGDNMIIALGERGGDLLDRLEEASNQTANAVLEASEQITANLNFKTNHIHDEFAELADNITNCSTTASSASPANSISVPMRSSTASRCAPNRFMTRSRIPATRC